MKKKSIYRIISIALSFVLAITVIGIGDIISAEQELSDAIANESDSIENSNVIVHNLPMMLTDWTGIADGAGIDGYTPRTYYTNLTDIARDGIRPRISAEGEGVDNSYALVIGGESKPVTQYEIALDFPKKGSLLRAVNHKFTMKVKLVEGSVDKLRLGVMEKTENEYVLEVSGDELTGEWQELSFEYRTSRNVANYKSRVLISYTAPDGGAKLLIDDILVTSGSRTDNLFGEGTFETKFFEESFVESEKEDGVTYKPFTVEDLKHQYLFGFDGSYDNEASTIAVEEGSGLSESYALKLKGDGKAHKLFLRFDSTGALQDGTQYKVGFKVKKSGDIDSIAFGICEQWNIHTALSFNKELSNDLFGDTYKYYSYNYITTSECSGSWSYIVIEYNLPENTTVYFDEIEIYQTDVEPKANVFSKGNFEKKAYMWAVDNTPIPDAYYAGYELSNYNPIKNYTDSNPKNALVNNDNASIINGEGVKNSCALKLEGTGSNMHFYITIGSGVGGLKSNTEYMFTVKLRREGAGKINSFTYGYNASWKETTLFDYNDETITDEYICFGAKSTLHDTASSGWCHLSVGFKAEVGATLYIDEIVIYKTDDESKTNIFTKGAFDVMYFMSDVDNTTIPDAAYEGYELTDYKPIKNYTDSDPKNALSNNDNASISKGDGVRGSYALKLDGTGEDMRFYITIGNGVGGLKSNTEYMFMVKLKRAGTGKINNFSYGYNASWKETTVIKFNDDMITDEYICFGGKSTLHSEASSGWCHLSIGFNAEVGTTLYVDEIVIYRTDDPEKANIFTTGTFDFMYYEKKFDNTVDPDIKFVPNTIETYTSSRFFLGFGYDTNKPEHKDDPQLNDVSIVEGEGANGSAALKIVGDGTQQQVFFRISVLGGMLNNCEYMLGFKVKRGAEFDTTDASFRMGMIERSALHSAIGFNGAALARNITDEYSYYYVYYTTTNECSGAWHYLAFTYMLPEGAEIYLDDIEVIPVTEKAIWMRHGDESAINLIRQGDFDMVDLGQDEVKWLDSEQLPENEESYGGGLAIKDAITGHHALGFGFDPQNKVTKSWEKNLVPSDPGDTHKISFWIKVVGDATASFSIGDSAWLTKTYEMDFNKYEHGKWTKVELYYTDIYTRYNCVTYRRVRFNINASAGSGVLIDNIEIYRVGDEYKLNVYAGAVGNFENYTDYPAVKWSDRYLHKKGN